MPDQPDVHDGRESSLFESFYQREYTGTARLAGFLSGDRSIAEDIAQEAFIRLRPEFGHLENPGGYLRTTVVNLCRNHHRRRWRPRSGVTAGGAQVPMAC